MTRPKVTISVLREKMSAGTPITMLTAYDYPIAAIEEKAGIDIILCGDSLGMTVLGYDSTLPVTMDIMVAHAAAVRRGAPTAFLVGDMPYMSYQVSVEEAIRNAGRFMAEAGCDCIKLEGGQNQARTVKAIVDATIPVMGHIGLTPQSIAQLGGFKAQGRDASTALRLIDDALALQDAGICSLLVEAVPPPIMELIVERMDVPVISLGSGPHGAGQCLIVHDILGFFDRFTPKFVKKYCNVNQTIYDALATFKNEVEERVFPEEQHTYGIKDEVVEEVKARLAVTKHNCCK